MDKTFKVIYSILAVLMLVNSFVVALPILGHAQAAKKLPTLQSEPSHPQKAEIEKAQREAKLLSYKNLNLSTEEVKFLEKYSAKTDIFYQVVDKYVDYDKTNGNANINALAIYQI